MNFLMQIAAWFLFGLDYMQSCPECGSDVINASGRCPQCGHYALKAKPAWVVFYVTALLGLVALVALAGAYAFGCIR